MATRVIMPQFGESVVEGTITRWLKRAGERVELHEPLVEVNTDKVDTEVPSPASGMVLEIYIEEGVTVQAGTVLAAIGKPGEEVLPWQEIPGEMQAIPGSKTVKRPDEETKTEGKVPRVRMGRDKVLGFISPLVARLASEHQVDLHAVKGSGLGGRITKEDVQDYIKRQTTQPRATHEEAQTAIKASSPTSPHLPGDELQPLSVMRRRIAEHMSLSKRTSPHVTTVMEADLSRVTTHRQIHKESFAHSGVNLTYSAYFVKAASAALRAYPIVNSSFHEQGIFLHQQVNIGVAVALAEGLIVPVIKGADTLSLLGLAQALNELADRARSGHLLPEEVQQGTFTITNHGVSGSLLATPIINQPQCAILGVGAIQKRPVVIEVDGTDALAIRPMVYLSLTFDHRILDGALADHFLAKIVSMLETYDTEPDTIS